MNPNLRLLGLFIIVGGALIVGCGGPVSDANIKNADSSSPSEEAESIAWFEGTVEEAFAAAKDQNKPLFLYWGAVWCPPCHYLKNTIFKKPEFVAQSRKFVAVYLDGDTERAQRWGEKLQTIGYPTVLVLNPQGQEVMRMTAGIPVQEFNGVLDAALAQMKPVNEVLTAILESPEEPSVDDLKLLAFHSWGQDTQVDLEPDQLFAAFRDLDQKTPESQKIIKSRFLALTLDEAKGATPEEPRITAEERTQFRSRVIELLQDRETRNANVYFTTFGVWGTVDLLEPELGASRDELISIWRESLEAFDADESLFVTDRVYGVGAFVDLHRASLSLQENAPEEETLPEEVLDRVRQKIAWANERVQDESELQSVMNTMANVMKDVGLFDELEVIIAARIDDTMAPHYYMSWLSSLQEQKGKTAEALEWRRKAYDRSEGPNTRFQWGHGYVNKIIALTPDDLETIQKATTEVLQELLTHDEAFESRNLSRLQSLDRALTEWGPEGERKAVVDGIRDLVHSHCSQYSAEGEDSLQSRCEAFLVSAEA